MPQALGRSPAPSFLGAPAPREHSAEVEDPQGPGQDVDELLQCNSRQPAPSPTKANAALRSPFWLETGSLAEASQLLMCPGRRTVEGPVGYAPVLADAFNRWKVWTLVGTFVALALGSWAFTGETLFGHVTGGVVESLVLAKSQALGLSMQAHILGGSTMWFLGFVQVMCKCLRRSARLSILHRISGRVFLLIWALVVGPTAAHLSLFVGVGSANMQLLMTAFAICGLDTTLLAYYFFWKALQLARLRTSHDALQLHGRAMRTGLACTLLIVWQRPIQLWFIGIRKLLLLALGSLGGPGSIIDSVFSSILGHHASLALTTVFLGAGFLPLLLDGPHSRFFCILLDVQTEEDRIKFFGAAEPSPREILLWRMRVPLYLGLRALVTAGWTAEPADSWPGPSLGLNTDMLAGLY